MIDFVINNPKAVFVAVMPIVMMIPISVYSMITRREAEIAVLKEYKKRQVEHDQMVTERGANMIEECKVKVNNLNENMAGDSETMAEFGNVNEKLDLIRLNLDSMTANHETIQGTLKKALENLPTEFNLDDVMYIYVSYTFMVLVYKWWKTGSIIEGEEISIDI